MSRYLPVVLGVLVIVGLTIPQIRMSDRFAGGNITAQQKAQLLQNVPMNIGEWHGENQEVSKVVQDVAGAEGFVSRTYRNARTGDTVDLWLIVGHARDVSAHTPNICYRASGFEARADENSLYPIIVPGQADAPFWTNTFFKEDAVTGRQIMRVFWSWHNPESQEEQGKVVWEAPSNPRWWFGNTRALYKMYFTSVMPDPMETAERSACLQFAQEFMPVVNKALAEIHSEEAGDAASTDTTQNAAPNTSETQTSPAAEPETAESPAVEAPPAAEPTATEAQ